MATEKLSSVHPRLVLAVGRVVPYKGFEVLIEALAGLDATAMIFGDGRQAKRLQTTRHRTPNDRVFFTGSTRKSPAKNLSS